MQKLPLYFRIWQLVFGNGFVASVEIVGRATAAEDFGILWIYGVNPGGIAQSGADLASAYSNFRRWFTEVLFDLAEMAGEFEEFRRTAEGFLRATDDDRVREWRAARQAIREGNRPDLEVVMRIEPDDLDIEFTAEDLTEAMQSPSPELNRLPDLTPAELAA